MPRAAYFIGTDFRGSFAGPFSSDSINTLITALNIVIDAQFHNPQLN